MHRQILCRARSPALLTSAPTRHLAKQNFAAIRRHVSSTTQLPQQGSQSQAKNSESSSAETKATASQRMQPKATAKPAAKAKTVAELDEEMRQKLEAMSGGQAGVEYENGVAAGLKSEVKRNMFRVINMPR
jgi:guanyl-specific ribonuclease Sa